MNGLTRPGLRVVLFLAAGTLPWAVLMWQEAIRYSDAKVHLWPAGTLAAALFLAALVVLALPASPDSSPAVPSRRSRWRALAAVLLGAGGAIFLLSELRRLCRLFWMIPASPTYADMMPLMQSAVRTFFRDHENPYRVHEVASWSLHLTFTPGLWLPYGLPWMLGVDIRLWTATALVLTGAALIAKAAIDLAAARSLPEALVAAPALVALIALFKAPHLAGFVPSVHVAGMWFALAGWGLAVVLRRHFAAGLFLGLAIISRPYMAFVLPFWLVYVALNLRSTPRRVLAECLGMALPAAVAFAFLLNDPAAYLHGPLKEYDAQLMPQVLADPFRTHGFGLTAALHESGLLKWRMTLTLALEAGLLFLFGRSLRRPETLLLASAAALFVFLSLSLIPWHYLFVDVLVLLAFWSPLRAPRPTAEVRQVVAAGMFLFVLAAGATMVREVRRPPVRVPRDASPNLRELDQLRLEVAGFDYNVWTPNDGVWRRLMVDRNCYVAFPVHHITGRELAVDIDNAGSTELALRLTLNTQVLSSEIVPPGRHTLRLSVPPGTLFRGLNLLRIERRADTPGDHFLAHIVLDPEQP